MARQQVDRDVSFMKENWGTTMLVTDYGAMTPTRKRKSPSKYNVKYAEYDGEWV